MTRMPHRPSTTLGIAASSSTSMPTGVRRRRGASSLRKRPIASDSGTARTSAKNEVTAVPQIRSAAPNWLVTAFHSFVVRNERPNSEIAGDASSVTL